MKIFRYAWKLIRNVRNEVLALSWTLGGTGLVLITLSGETLKWGLWISGLSLFFHLLGVLFFSNSDN